MGQKVWEWYYWWQFQMTFYNNQYLLHIIYGVTMVFLVIPKLLHFLTWFPTRVLAYFFYSEKITFLAQNHHSLSWVWVKNGGGLTWKIGKKETILDNEKKYFWEIVMLISVYFHSALQGKLFFSSFSSESVSTSISISLSVPL